MLSPTKEKMRCRACGQRIMRNLGICPHCGRHPARFHTRWRFTLVSLLLGLGLGLGLAPLAPLPNTAALLNETATPLPQPLRRPTFTPTATPTPLPSATPTQTATPPPTTTQTATPPPVRTLAPTTTPAPTPTPRPTMAAPRLVSPPEQAEFGGEDALILLDWEGALAEGQQFAVTIQYVGRNNDTKTVGAWLRERRYRVPLPTYRDISVTLRALKWSVTILDANGEPVSPASESRIFIWVQ